MWFVEEIAKGFLICAGLVIFLCILGGILLGILELF